MKNIQIILDNLTKDINKILETARSYVDAASNVLNDIQNLITSASAKLSKYMKPIFDKIQQFIVKTVQKGYGTSSKYYVPQYEEYDV